MEEENRTRKALDELAALFLTGAAGGAADDAAQDPGAGQPPAPAAPPATARSHEQAANGESGHTSANPASGHASGVTKPAGHTAATPPRRVGDDLLGGPEPIRLAPKLRPPGDDAAGRSPLSMVGSSTSPRLRLHPGGRPGGATLGSRSGESASPPAPEAEVQAVLLGNLPGLSGPWLTQYAQSLAQRQGPVALLHVDDEAIDVELLEPTDRPQGAGRLSPGTGSLGLVDRLESLVNDEHAPVRTILLHLDAQIEQPALGRLAVIERWTVLCGADNAAVESAYRSLRRLIEADESLAATRVGAMIMGCNREVGEAAAHRLGSAMSGLLDTPVELVGTQQQMMPLNLRQMGTFEPTVALWPRLVAWLEQLTPPAKPTTHSGTPREARAADAPRTRQAPAPAADPRDAFTDALAAAEPDAEFGWDEVDPPDDAYAEPVDGPSPGHANATVQDSPKSSERARPAQPAEAFEPFELAEPVAAAVAAPAPPRERAAPRASVLPQPALASHDAAAHEPASPGAAVEPDLSSFLTGAAGGLAGGMALEARCPHQPRTQLVLDQRGGLHLLRRHASAKADRALPAGPAEEPALHELRAAVLDLIESRKWVQEHVELLELTQRQCRFDRQAQPVLHLFTDRADLATGLVARLGSSLKLHLLQSVRVGEQSTWFSTPLS